MTRDSSHIRRTPPPRRTCARAPPSRLRAAGTPAGAPPRCAAGCPPWWGPAAGTGLRSPAAPAQTPTPAPAGGGGSGPAPAPADPRGRSRAP
eukprot:1177209-Prorocentrum_minimum.AAC.5